MGMFEATTVELSILSSSITAVQIKEYETRVDQYKEELEMYERMGIGLEPKEPEAPEEVVEYKEVHYNFENRIIKSWIPSYDTQRKADIIVLDIFDTDCNRDEQLNIKMTKTDWVKFLKKNGCNTTKP